MAKQPRILVGQVAAVTGAARGIGKATAHAFVREGMKVAIGDIDGELAEATAAELGPNAAGFELDVTRRESFEAFVDAIDVDVRAHAGFAGNSRVRDEMADDVPRAVLEARIRTGLVHPPAEHGLIERRGRFRVARGDAQVGDPGAPKDS